MNLSCIFEPPETQYESCTVMRAPEPAERPQDPLHDEGRALETTALTAVTVTAQVLTSFLALVTVIFVDPIFTPVTLPPASTEAIVVSSDLKVACWEMVILDVAPIATLKVAGEMVKPDALAAASFAAEDVGLEQLIKAIPTSATRITQVFFSIDSPIKMCFTRMSAYGHQ